MIHVRRLIHDAVTAVIEDEPLGAPTSLGLAESHAAVKHPMGGRQELCSLEDHLDHMLVDHPSSSLCRVTVDVEDIDDTSPES
jgi:hypothetical protein